jgi:cell division protein FtsB
MLAKLDCFILVYVVLNVWMLLYLWAETHHQRRQIEALERRMDLANRTQDVVEGYVGHASYVNRVSQHWN